MCSSHEATHGGEVTAEEDPETNKERGEGPVFHGQENGGESASVGTSFRAVEQNSHHENEEALLACPEDVPKQKQQQTKTALEQ